MIKREITKVIYILLSMFMLIPAFGADLIAFRLAADKEVNGWKKYTHHYHEDIWVSPTTELNEKYIVSAKLEFGEFFSPSLILSFTPQGKKQLKSLTTHHMGQKVAIIFEGKLLIAATIMEPIPNGMLQVGVSTIEQAKEIVQKLNKR